jgi:four helix bundle protein
MKSSRSSPSNLAEGFGAFYPKEFARFCRIARRSLIETRNHLKDGRGRGYFSADTSNKRCHLSLRAQKATTRLIKYLESCNGRPPDGWNIR